MKKLLFSCSLWLLPTLTWAAAGDVWLEPAPTTVATNTPFGLQLLVDSGTSKVGAYGVRIFFDPYLLQVDASTSSSAITNGTNALSSNIYNVNNEVGTLDIAGFVAGSVVQGIGPGTNLQLFTINFITQATAGAAQVELVVRDLTTENGVTLDSPSGWGSTVTIGTPAARPDLVVTAATISPITPTVNGTFSAAVTVRNRGPVAGNGGYLDIWQHQPAVPVCGATGNLRQAIGTLAAGAAKTVTFTGLAAGSSTGNKTLRAFVDSACGTVENSETNNQFTQSYNVVGAAVLLSTTSAATNVSATSATLNGSVISTSAVVNVFFDFSDYGNYITATPSQVYSSSAVAVSTNATGLTCNTVYRYRVIARNSAAVINYGIDQSFTTAVCSGITYTVTPSANSNGSVSPNSVQTVSPSAVASFTVYPNSGYTKNSVVSGTCPLGSWNGNVWTTGAITANCTVIFSFTQAPVNSWLYPPNPIVVTGHDFTLAVHVNSNGVKVGEYSFDINFDNTKFIVNTLYQNASGQCVAGVCPGTSALANRVNTVDNNAGRLTLAGYDAVGTGPSNDLQLLVIHFIARSNDGVWPVDLTTTNLATTSGDVIGLGASGANVFVTYGLCGDSDGNGTVNLIDALAIARKLVNLLPPPTINTRLADVDRDTWVSVADELQILRYYVGLPVGDPNACAIGLPLPPGN